MKRTVLAFPLILVLLLGLLFLPAQAASLLDQLLLMQRTTYPSACITSGFWDPRGVSRYRSQPGIHLGYDIAMPYGTPVRAAWPGTVTAIVPWAQSEWGVTVVHSDGTSATYGHVQPYRVWVGQSVQSGQVIAQIASDHLDVKMRTAQGVHFDYARALATAKLDLSSPSLDIAPSPPSWPSPEVMDLQNQLRRQLHSAEGLRTNKRTALGQSPKNSPAAIDEKLNKFIELVGSKKIAWENKDRQRLSHLSDEHEKLQTLYQAGLISDKEWATLNGRWKLWKAVISP